MTAGVCGPAAPSRAGAAAAGLLHFRLLLLLLLPLFVFQAGPADAEGVAAPEETAAAEGVAATDFRGKRIELEKPAERIVCLLESALTGLYMLGAEDRLVGISTNVYQGSVFPYYAAMDERIRERTLPTPGNWDFVNIESMVALQPDLVIVWSGQEESIEALEEKGIPVFGVFIERFEDIHREIAALGELTGTRERAAELLAIAEQELEAVRRRVAPAEGEGPLALPRVYFMWAQGPLQTAGRNSTVQELIDLAGGTNVAAGSELESPAGEPGERPRLEPRADRHVVQRPPRAGEVGEMAGWRSLSAVREGRVHELPDPFSCDFWTLKYIFTVELVARWCHPDRFPEDDAEVLRANLLNKLYGGRLGELPPLSSGQDRG